MNKYIHILYLTVLLAGCGGGSGAEEEENYSYQDNSNSYTDFNNSSETAEYIWPNTSYSGAVDYYSDQYDYFRIELTSSGNLNIDLTGPSGEDLDLYLIDSYGSYAVSATTYSNIEHISYAVTVPATYYIAVKAGIGHSGSYSLSTVFMTDSGSITEAEQQESTNYNDDTFNAQLININQSVSGAVNSSIDTFDYFKIELTSSGNLNIDLTGPTGEDLDLYLIDSYGSYVVSATTYSNIEHISYTVTVPATYYIAVKAGIGHSGNYIFSTEFTDSGSGAEQQETTNYNDDTLNAQLININQSISGSVNSSVDAFDYFKIEATSSGFLNIDLTGPSGEDLDLYLYDSYGSHIVSATTNSNIEHISYTVNVPATYYIAVKAGTGHSGAYIFSTEFTANGVPVSTQQETASYNNDTLNSQLISINANISGHANSVSDDADYYKLVLNNSDTINIHLVGPSTEDFDLFFYDPSGTSLSSSTSSNSDETISYSISNTGTYHIKVSAYSGSGNYILSVQ